LDYSLNIKEIKFEDLKFEKEEDFLLFKKFIICKMLSILL